MAEGQLYIISAPSGAGKTTLVNALLTKLSNIRVSVSHTTRPKRPNDIEGKDYFFIDEALFAEYVRTSAFLEYAQVFNYHYGTSRAFVLEHLAQGMDIILEIDWQGGLQVRAEFSQAISIFIFPPSWEQLEQRLRARKSDSDEVIAHRLSKASEEMRHALAYDYWVINDDLTQATEDLLAIIRASRQSRDYQAKTHNALIHDLLAQR